MKNRKRFDYANLAEVLSQEGIAEPEMINSALKAGAAAGIPFPEILLTQDIISDWELSRIVCKLYHLAFLTVDLYTPSTEALQTLPADFVRQHRLIPVSLHGGLLTVLMPALVPAEVISEVASMTELNVIAVVGTVQTNGRWILENLPEHAGAARANAPQAGAIPDFVEAQSTSGGTAWGSFFDEADAAVLMDLEVQAKTLNQSFVPGGSDEDNLPAFALDDFDEEPDLLADEDGEAADDEHNEIPPLPEVA